MLPGEVVHGIPAWLSDRLQDGARRLLLVAGCCLSMVEAQRCLAAQLSSRVLQDASSL